MTSQYYTLVVQHTPGEAFGIEFGDYTKADVLAEAKSMRESYGLTVAQTRILKTDARQSSIQAAVSRLNSELKLTPRSTHP